MGEADMPAVVHYNRDRRRSSFTRPMRDPEEILEGLRALKAARRDLNRTMSLVGDKRRESREYDYVASLLAIISPNHSLVRPSSLRSSIRAIVCLSVRLSVCLSCTRRFTSIFHFLSSTLFLYIYFLFLSLSLSVYFCVSRFLQLFSHHHCSRSLDRRSARSIIVHQPIEADRIFLVGGRRAYRTHANKCVCTDVHVYV